MWNNVIYNNDILTFVQELRCMMSYIVQFVNMLPVDLSVVFVANMVPLRSLAISMKVNTVIYLRAKQIFWEKFWQPHCSAHLNKFKQWKNSFRFAHKDT